MAYTDVSARRAKEPVQHSAGGDEELLLDRDRRDPRLAQPRGGEAQGELRRGDEHEGVPRGLLPRRRGHLDLRTRSQSRATRSRWSATTRSAPGPRRTRSQSRRIWSFRSANTSRAQARIETRSSRPPRPNTTSSPAPAATASFPSSGWIRSAQRRSAEILSARGVPSIRQRFVSRLTVRAKESLSRRCPNGGTPLIPPRAGAECRPASSSPASAGDDAPASIGSVRPHDHELVGGRASWSTSRARRLVGSSSRGFRSRGRKGSELPLGDHPIAGSIR